MASHASYNITIEPTSAAAGSDQSSSISDDEDSSGTGVQVSPTSAAGSQEYSDPLDENEGSWVLYPHEIGPSDSASRPRTSNQHRPILEAPQPDPVRRQSAHRQRPNERAHHHPVPRARRPHLPTSSGSVDSHEEWPAYGHGPPQYYGRTYAHYGHATAASPPNYAPSYSSATGYPPFPTTNVPPPGQQLVPFASPPVNYNYPPYQGAAAGGQAPGYFPPPQHAAPSLGNPMIHHPGAPPYSGQEMIHHNQTAQFYPYPPQGYGMHQAVAPAAAYLPFQAVYSPSPVPANTTPPPSTDNSKDDEQFARIEKLFLDQKAEQAAKEAAAIKASEEAAAKAAADKKYAEDIAAAAAAAAAAATEEAEKKAADKAAEEAAKAAEEAAKAKAAADEAEKKAAEAAAAAPPPPPPPPEEKKKPIRFKDAVGRKFSFPFNLCSTWDVSLRPFRVRCYCTVTNSGLRSQGMDELIRQAFLHVEVIGPHVAEGHYDLVGPNGEIILPQVWETVIEPDWTITMHMWPMPEPPPPPDPPPDGAAEPLVIDVPLNDGKVPPPPPPPPPPGAKKIVKGAKPSPFLAWTAGKSKKGKFLKAGRKLEGTGPVALIQGVIDWCQNDDSLVKRGGSHGPQGPVRHLVRSLKLIAFWRS
ncbi:MAG: hypothetical protein Q9172_000827 [Xanthocarpia lactea]